MIYYDKWGFNGMKMVVSINGECPNSWIVYNGKSQSKMDEN
jgi:hypothetical protein